MNGYSEEDFTIAKGILELAQAEQKKYADRHRRDVEFQIGDSVMLSTGQGKQAFLKGPGIQPDSKFRQRYVGPFVIKGKISRNAYLLELPRSWEAHPVFHVSRLKPWREGERIRRTIPATRPQPVRKTHVS